jgi:hypothetical protein
VYLYVTTTDSVALSGLDGNNIVRTLQYRVFKRPTDTTEPLEGYFKIENLTISEKVLLWHMFCHNLQVSHSKGATGPDTRLLPNNTLSCGFPLFTKVSFDCGE